MAVSKSIEGRYSPTFDSGHSEKRTTSKRQTENLPLIAITVNTSTLKTSKKGTPLTFGQRTRRAPRSAALLYKSTSKWTGWLASVGVVTN